MSDVATPAAQAELSPSDWTGAAGERWASHVDYFETMLNEVGLALLAHAAFAPGEHVVEIGCGGGALTRAVAAAVAPGGEVLGLDISPALVALASERALAEHVDNVAFVAGDAQAMRPARAPFDRLISRFGVMFFADPAAAMANLHAMLKPGGRLDFAVWGAIEGNPWISAAMQAARPYLDLPEPAPDAPGPFAFADADYLRSLLQRGGFGAIRFTPWAGTVRLGGPGVTAEEAAETAIVTGPLADLLKETAEHVRAAIKSDLADLFRPYVTSEGMVAPASVHLVTAIA
jgi:SAM-dependent methyltransferase